MGMMVPMPSNALRPFAFNCTFMPGTWWRCQRRWAFASSGTAPRCRRPACVSANKVSRSRLEVARLVDQHGNEAKQQRCIGQNADWSAACDGRTHVLCHTPARARPAAWRIEASAPPRIRCRTAGVRRGSGRPADRVLEAGQRVDVAAQEDKVRLRTRKQRRDGMRHTPRKNRTGSATDTHPRPRARSARARTAMTSSTRRHPTAHVADVAVLGAALQLLDIERRGQERRLFVDCAV